MKLTEDQKEILDENLVDEIIRQTQELEEMGEARRSLRSIRDELQGMGFIPELRMVSARMSAMLRKDDITQHDMDEVLELMNRQRVRDFFFYDTNIAYEFIRIANVYDARFLSRE
jgi:hypothetical protein